MHKAEIEEQGNYRDPLYKVFKFGPEMYDVGRCGYKELAERLEEEDALSNLSIHNT